MVQMPDLPYRPDGLESPVSDWSFTDLIICTSSRIVRTKPIAIQQYSSFSSQIKSHAYFTETVTITDINASSAQTPNLTALSGDCGPLRPGLLEPSSGHVIPARGHIATLAPGPLSGGGQQRMRRAKAGAGRGGPGTISKLWGTRPILLQAFYHCVQTRFCRVFLTPAVP